MEGSATEISTTLCLTGPAKILLEYLDERDVEDPSVIPSYDDIVKDVPFNGRTVHAAASELRFSGCVELIRSSSTTYVRILDEGKVEAVRLRLNRTCKSRH